MIVYLFITIITVCTVILAGIYLYKKEYGILTVPSVSSTIQTTSSSVCSTDEEPKLPPVTNSIPNTNPTYNIQKCPNNNHVNRNNVKTIIEGKTPEWFTSNSYIKDRTIKVPIIVHYILDIDYNINGNNYNTYVNLTNMNSIINSLNNIFSPLHISFYIKDDIIKENAYKNVGKYFWNRGQVNNSSIKSHLNMILDFFINKKNQQYFNSNTNNTYRTVAKFLLYTLIDDRSIVETGINIYLIPFLWQNKFSVISNAPNPIIFLPEYNYNLNNNISANFLKNNNQIIKSLSLNIARIFNMSKEEFKNMKHLSNHRLHYIRHLASKTYKPLNKVSKDILIMEEKGNQYNDYMKLCENTKFKMLYNDDIYIKDQIKKNLKLIDKFITNYFNTAFLRSEVKQE